MNGKLTPYEKWKHKRYMVWWYASQGCNVKIHGLSVEEPGKTHVAIIVDGKGTRSVWYI